MTRDEMQRFLDLPEMINLGELEALRRLMWVLGIQYHGDSGQDEEKNEKPSK